MRMTELMEMPTGDAHCNQGIGIELEKVVSKRISCLFHLTTLQNFKAILFSQHRVPYGTGRRVKFGRLCLTCANGYRNFVPLGSKYPFAYEYLRSHR